MSGDSMIDAVLAMLTWQEDRLREAYRLVAKFPDEAEVTAEAERIAHASERVGATIDTDDVRRNTILRAAAIVGARV